MQGLETVTHHRTTQNHTVVKLLCRQAVTGLILERIRVAAEVGQRASGQAWNHGYVRYAL